MENIRNEKAKNLKENVSTIHSECTLNVSPNSLVSVRIHLKPDYLWLKREVTLWNFSFEIYILCPKQDDLAGGKNRLDSFLNHKE